MLLNLLKTHRFSLTSEAQTQLEIEQILTQHEVKFTREHRFDRHSRVDFFCHDGTAIEIKLKGGAKAIYRQCERYCTFPEVKTLILFTAKTMGLPEKIEGKPCHVVFLGEGWL